MIVEFYHILSHKAISDGETPIAFYPLKIQTILFKISVSRIDLTKANKNSFSRKIPKMNLLVCHKTLKISISLKFQWLKRTSSHPHFGVIFDPHPFQQSFDTKNPAARTSYPFDGIF